MILDCVLRQRLSVHLDIRIYEVVERIALLAWGKLQVAAHREGDAGRIEMAKVVVAAGGIFSRLRGIDGNPFAPPVKIRPAVIAGKLRPPRFAGRKTHGGAGPDPPRTLPRQ